MTKKKTILVLAANPKDTPPVRLDEELREIRDGLARNHRGNTYAIEVRLAARAEDVRRALLDVSPTIVHFCGHGAGEEGLALEDKGGSTHLVAASAIANLFSLFSDCVECVLLNACFSEVQAKEISKCIPHVIGMSKAIGDKAAIEFAIGFYDAIAAGRQIPFAHKLGCASIHLAGLHDSLTPVLFSRSQATKASTSINPQTLIEDAKGPVDSTEASLREFYRHLLYHWNDSCADAIRFAGAQDEAFAVDHIELEIAKTPYVIPEPLTRGCDRTIALFKKRAEDTNSTFYDGPCVRLINYRARPHNLTERKYLELHIGQIGWYDYVLANQRFGDPEVAGFYGESQEVSQFVEFAKLRDTRDVRTCSLSNILTAYVSITTKDGYLIFAQRSEQAASHRSLLISAVSENLHPVKDHMFDHSDGRALFDSAARGIEEELSPDLKPLKPHSEIYLLGLEFHFQGFHPGLLYYAPVPFTRKEVERLLRNSPGKDYGERKGNLAQFVHLDDLAHLRETFDKLNWFAAGKASMIRTIEYLKARSGTASSSLAAVAANLAVRSE
jgi:hypothetical protein